MPLPSVPAPRTWASGDLVLAPRLRADVSDAVAFLAGRPFFMGQNKGGPTWGNGTDSNLGLNTELADPWNMHDYTSSGATSSKLFAQAPGWYLCRAAVPMVWNTATQAMFAAGFNWVNNGVTQTTIRGAQLFNGSGTAMMPQCCDLIQQTVTGAIGGSGDFIQATAFQNTGGNINLGNSATRFPTVSARWVCANTGTASLPVPPLTAVPSPITSAWLNANVRDTIRFLIYPPACKAVYAPGSATLASSSFPAGSAVPLNSTALDTYSAFNTSTFTYTAPVAGIYFCYGQTNLASTSAANAAYAAGFSVNGGTIQWADRTYKANADSSGGGATATRRLRLNAGDTVQFMATQGTGSAIAYNTGAIGQTRALFVWDGA
jgi:hypothetical protein